MSKNQGITFRVSADEEKFLLDLAKKNEMSLSGYIRARLFEDQNLDEDKEVSKGQKYQKDIMQQIAKSSALIAEIAKKELSENEMMEAIKKAKEWLEKNNY